jgi:hypothetical protein
MKLNARVTNGLFCSFPIQRFVAKWPRMPVCFSHVLDIRRYSGFEMATLGCALGALNTESQTRDLQLVRRTWVVGFRGNGHGYKLMIDYFMFVGQTKYSTLLLTLLRFRPTALVRFRMFRTFCGTPSMGDRSVPTQDNTKHHFCALMSLFHTKTD